MKRMRRHKHAHSSILYEIQKLGADRLAGHELTGALSGYRSLKIHVRGSGEYRALYSLNDAKSTVVVHWIGPRENFYADAQRHLTD